MSTSSEEIQTPDKTAQEPNTAPLNTTSNTTTSERKGRGFSRIGGWLSDLLGLGAKEEADLIDLAERRKRKRGIATATSEVERLAISAEMTVGELVHVLARATGTDQQVIDGFEDDTEHWIGN